MKTSNNLFIVGIVLLAASRVSAAFVQTTGLDPIELIETKPGTLQGCTESEVRSDFDLTLFGVIETVSPFLGVGTWSVSVSPGGIFEGDGYYHELTVCATALDFPVCDYVGMGTQELATIDLMVVPDEGVYNPLALAEGTVTFDFSQVKPIPTPSAILLGSIGIGCLHWLTRRRSL